MTDALLNFYNRLVADNTALGVLGLFCTPLTQLISPLAGREEIGLLQISASPSPLLRDNLQDYPLLHFALPSAAAYYNTMLRMMEAFDWSRVYIIAGTPGTHYFHTAESFYQAIASEDNFTVRFSYNNPTTLRDLRRSDFRIVFTSVDAQQAATLICQAHKEGLTSPLFAWVFYEHSLEDLLAFANQTCGVQTMTSALNGSFFLQFPPAQSDPQVTIVSGQTYQEYYSEYLDRLNSASTTQLQPNLYANVLHDQVWAFALALNGSLAILDEEISSLSEQPGVSTKFRITEVSKRAIANVSFEGARNKIGNSAPITVTILHIGPDGLPALEGYYDQISGSFNINTATDTVAKDEVLRRFNSSYGLPITILLSILMGAFTIMTTVVLILFIYYRNEPEIKATSPKLSLLMFLGCYLLITGVSVNTVGYSFQVPSNWDFILRAGCGFVIWCVSIGANLIFATLLVRMLRIYHIFNSYKKTGKLWSDGIMFAIVTIIIAVSILVLLIWSLVDTYSLKTIETFKQDFEDGEFPYFEVIQICDSKHTSLWVSLLLCELGLLLLAVTILAVMTRKISKENFKDTKKVNVYIFSLVLMIGTLCPIWYVLSKMNRSLSIIVLVVGFGIAAFLCQLLLFVPKVAPPLLRALKRKFPKAVIRKPAKAFTSKNSETTFILGNPSVQAC